MRNTIILLFVFITYAANAQFVILPQAGIENSKTYIKSSDFYSFSPMGNQLAPTLSVRMGYTFKSGHGAFLGISSSTPAVQLKFNDPQTARTSFKASGEDLQFGLEGGYQYSFKPIALGKPHSNKSGHGGEYSQHRCGEQKSCSGHMKCGQHNSTYHFDKATANRNTHSKGWFVRIKPSVGFAFLPTEKGEIESETNGAVSNYEYNAGWKTAMIAGTAFEFGTRHQAKFVVSLNYFHSLGSNSQSLSTVDNAKTTAHTFQSYTSGFNLKVGIPINLQPSRKVAAKLHTQWYNAPHKMHCGLYRMLYQK